MTYFVIISIVVLILVFLNFQPKQQVRKQKSQEQIEKENEIKAIVEQAIQNNKKLFIGYKSSYGYSGEEYTERVVIPKTVSLGSELNQTSPLKEGEWIDEDYYMFAYCELRNEERHFRLDRIQSIKII